MNSKRLWGRILLLGLGFFALGTINSIYEAYMPEMFEKLVGASTVVGLLMALDNVLGMLFFPYFGALSDRTETRLGKRLPFVLAGLPLVGLGMVAIPFAFDTGVLALLVLSSVLMNFSVTVARSPLAAMLPDSAPAERRPVGFGVMMSLLGLGSIVGLGVGRKLHETNDAGPWLLSGAIFFVVTVVYLLFLREPKERQTDSRVEETPQRLLQSLKELWANPDPVTLFFFGSVLFVFMAQQSVTTWFTLYGSERFNMTVNEVTLGLLALGGMLVLAAIPGGYIGSRFGRRRAVLGGMVGMVISTLLLFIVPSFGPTVGCMALFGISLITVVVNTYPMALELCRPSQVGTYTGLYYMCQYGAGIFGPPLVGAIFDLAGGKRPLFLVVALFAAISIGLMLRALKSPAIAENPRAASPAGL